MSVAVTPEVAVTAIPAEEGYASRAADLAEVMQKAYLQQYVDARHQYKASHAQYTSRSKRSPPSWLQQYCSAAPQNLSSYTSAVNDEECCPPSTCSHGPRRIGLHGLNYELRQLALRRMRAPTPKPAETVEAVIDLLKEQEAAEYADLLQLEAAAFVRVARVYYNEIHGPTDELVWGEQQARRMLEDEYRHSHALFLAELREQLWVMEQCLFLRATGHCPELLPHIAQLKLEAAAAYALQQTEVVPLDSREAVPLWQRVCAIRGETECEEDICYRRLLLAFVVQSQCLNDGYLRRDTVNGHLRVTYGHIPEYMHDAVDYALQFEVFAAVQDEETHRMRLMEEYGEAAVALLTSAAESMKEAIAAAATMGTDAANPAVAVTAAVP